MAEKPESAAGSVPLQVVLENEIQGIQNYVGRYGNGGLFKEYLALALTQVVDAARDEQREKDARDVCMYCGGRAPQYERLAEGPNEAGNYTHAAKKGDAAAFRVLCHASAIYVRKRAVELGIREGRR